MIAKLIAICHASCSRRDPTRNLLAPVEPLPSCRAEMVPRIALRGRATVRVLTSPSLFLGGRTRRKLPSRKEPSLVTCVTSITVSLAASKKLPSAPSPRRSSTISIMFSHHFPIRSWRLHSVPSWDQGSEALWFAIRPAFIDRDPSKLLTIVVINSRRGIAVTLRVNRSGFQKRHES